MRCGKRVLSVTHATVTEPVMVIYAIALHETCRICSNINTSPLVHISRRVCVWMCAQDLLLSECPRASGNCSSSVPLPSAPRLAQTFNTTRHPNEGTSRRTAAAQYKQRLVQFSRFRYRTIFIPLCAAELFYCIGTEVGLLSQYAFHRNVQHCFNIDGNSKM